VSDGQYHYILLPFTMNLPAFSVAGQQALMPLLDRARQAALTAVPSAQVIQAGVVFHAAAAAQQARREMTLIGVGSFAGIVLLTWLTFYSLVPIALITLSIAVGFLGALSISWLLFGGIHVVTLVFGASLIGVAEDYGIYFLCKRAGAQERLDSLQLLRRVLPALVMTLVSTAIGYMGLVLTPFPGLRQMAVFSVAGLLFAWFTVVFWFPSLAHPSSLRNRGLLDRYADQLTGWPVLHGGRRMSLTIAGVLTLALVAWLALDVQDDIRSLQNPPKNLVAEQLKLNKLLDLPAPAQFYLVRGDTAETVLQREEALTQRLDGLIDNQTISGYHAISNWVPSARQQGLRRQLIERSVLKEDGALYTLTVRLGEERRWAELMSARWLGANIPLLPEDFLKSAASEPWRYLWVGKVGDSYASIVALRGVNKDSLATLERAGASLEGVQWVDKVGQISVLLAEYRRYMSWVLLLSFLMIYGLLYLRYGEDSWRIIAPTAIATVATLALLAFSGQALQLFHVLGLMLVLGIGVDYGIFFQEPGNQRDDAAWLAAGVSAISTLLSFGLLGLSRTPALQAFGLTMALGIALVTLLVPCFRREVPGKMAL
jgi:predicted exporter